MSAVTTRLPYPGLRSFRRNESDLFFGREDCINAMVDRLAATRFLAVLGSSGTGKSSLVRTGLLDALELGVMSGAGSAWRVIDFRPGGAPLLNLARGLIGAGTGSEAAGNVRADEAGLLRAFLLRGPRSIAEWCGDGHLPPNTNLLLLVDQFEELFRYQDYAGREEAEAFTALLLESAGQRQFPIYVALTMRSEYLGACALVDGLAEAISAGLFLIPRMMREQCRAAIVGPAAVCGFKLENALVSRLLNDLAAFAPFEDRGARDQLDRIARRADQLPLLQYCLNRMWVQAQQTNGNGAIVLTVDDYERIGQLSGALNAHADEILRALGEVRQSTAEKVFRALTEGSSVSDAVRRPTRFAELVRLCNGDDVGARAVVDAFRSSGCDFLVPELNQNDPEPVADDTIIDISHESLIRQWKRLSEWVEAEAHDRRQWQRLNDRAQDGYPLYGEELASALNLYEASKNDRRRISRYGAGSTPAIFNFLKNSERHRRRFAPLVLPLINISIHVAGSLLLITVGTLVGLFMNVKNNGVAELFSEDSSGWFIHALVGYANFIAAISPGWEDYLFLVVPITIAITSFFGLWRYTVFGAKRALFAGIAIYLASALGGIAFGHLLPRFGVGTDEIRNWWNVTLSPLAVVAPIAVFYSNFRKVSMWLPLVVTFAGVSALDFVPNQPTILSFLPLSLCIWVVFGLQLRRANDLTEMTLTRH